MAKQQLTETAIIFPEPIETPYAGAGKILSGSLASSQNHIPMTSIRKVRSNWIILVLFTFFLFLTIWISMHYNLKMKEIDLIIEQTRSQIETPVPLQNP